MEMRLATVGDAPDNAGTLLMGELTRMLAEVPRARVAGAILLTDGQLHDPGLVPDMPAPIHALLTGREGDWDRRLVIETAPAFAIIGEEFQLQLRIEDQGAIPADLAGRSEILIAIDGEEPRPFTVPVGETLNLPLTLERAGQNVIQFIVPEADGELTNRNNAAVVQINGIRDRLRVLLVSGEPHPGPAHMAQPAEIRSVRGPGAFHHPQAAGQAGRRAGVGTVADRLPHAGAVHGSGG
jgi:hypothetical protein